MSLRWKLFRFLANNTLLDPAPEQIDPETPLFPSLSPAHDHENQARQALFRRLAIAADRSHDSDSVHGIYLFALPRAVVQFFNLAIADAALALGPVQVAFPASTPLQYTFSAHDVSVAAIALVRGEGNALPWLITLGVDDNISSVKVWAFNIQSTINSQIASSTRQSLEARSKSSPWGRPTLDENRLECIAVHRISSEAPPTTLAVRDARTGISSISQLAVGFGDGSVTILTGDLCHERSTRVRVAPAPGEMIEAKPISFVSYCEDWLYCVSEMSVCIIVPVPQTDDKIAFRRQILDNLGIQKSKLCCVLKQSAELVVAKDEALYFFNHDGRGPCLAFPTEGKNASISSAGNYIIHSTGSNSITAYDVVNKLIAYRGKGYVSCAFDGHVKGVRNVILCVAGGSIIKLSEIPLENRVNMLLKRGLYVAAVALARAESAVLPEDQREILTKALRQYAEYLMTKDRYDEAAEQLVETIGAGVEPSWVITRLVEQSGLRSGLRHYLEKLHAAGKAAFVHTKVLITCYRHDRARGIILATKGNEKTTDEYVINVFSDVDWSEDQVDAAISLCRDAGLFHVAERVSRRRGRYVQLALTLVEDLEEPAKALELLKSLMDEDALDVIKAVGRKLLLRDPESFVYYLSDVLCESTSSMAPGAKEPILRLDGFLPMFIDKPGWRAVLLDRIVKTPGGVTPAEAPKVWLLLFESLVNVDVAERLRPENSAHSRSSDDEGKSDFDVMSESGRAFRDGAPTDAIPTAKRDRRAMGRRALKILQSRRSVIDLRAALKIAAQYGHDPCLEYLYEHLHMYPELGICLRMAENGHSLLRACRRHGDREAQLWIECIRLCAPWAAEEEVNRKEDGKGTEGGAPANARSKDGWNIPVDLESVTSDESALSRITRDTEQEKLNAQDVLDEAILALDRSGTLSAVEIIDVVSKACPSGTWGLIREYFERCSAALRRDATTSEHSSMLLETELKELRKEAKRLEDTVVIKPKTCASCEDPLSVPAVHFLCEHSFHSSCLAPGGVGAGMGSSDGIGRENESESYGSYKGGRLVDERVGMWAEECPICAPELDAMVSMRQALQEKNGRQDEFFGTLKGSRDGFSTIIEFLERSPFI